MLGVIDLPFLDSRYTAVQGHGARRDGEPIRVSNVDRLQDAIVSIGDYAVGESADRKNGPRLSITGHLAGSALRVRMFGSAAIDLAWLAEGKTDGVVMLANKPRDTAAGVILAREAGALVVDTDGSDHTTDATATIAAAPEPLDALLALIRPSLGCVSA